MSKQFDFSNCSLKESDFSNVNLFDRISDTFLAIRLIGKNLMAELISLSVTLMILCLLG
jgi:hypothetical protein